MWIVRWSPLGHDEHPLDVPADGEANQDELDNAATFHVSDSMVSNVEGPCCCHVPSDTKLFTKIPWDFFFIILKQVVPKKQHKCFSINFLESQSGRKQKFMFRNIYIGNALCFTVENGLA